MDGKQLDDPANHPFPINRVIQFVFDSSRLTFEDESSVRHTLTITKAPSSWRTLGLGSLVLGTGMLFSPQVRSFIPTTLQNLQPLVRRILLASTASGFCFVAADRIIQQALVSQVHALVDLIQEISRISKTVTRWVQDNEVIHRGYMLVTAEQQEKGKVLSARACLRLRRAAFLETRFMVFILRAAAVDLLREVYEGKILVCSRNTDPLSVVDRRTRKS